MKNKTEDFILRLIPVFILASLLPMMFLRDFTPSNEIRYLSIVDEMLANGKFFSLSFNGAPYADKPPLYFWLIAICRLLAGSHCMPLLSFLSAIPGLITICIMDKWISEEALFSKRERIALMLILGSCAMFLGLLFFLRMDLWMTMFITLALYSFYRNYSGKANADLHGILFPIWTFLGLFTKGPVGLLMPVVSVVAFLLWEQRFKEAGKWIGWKFWLTIVILCLLWLSLAYRDGGIDYLKNLLFHQTLDRAVNAFHHKEPFWFYILTIWYVAAPWMLLLIPGIVNSVANRRTLNISQRLFACAAGSTFVMLSIFSSKLSVYLVPILPFLVYLQPVSDIREKKISAWDAAAVSIPAIFLVIVGISVSLLPYLAGCSESIAKLTEEYCFVFNKTIKAGMLILTVGAATSAVFAIRKKDWIKSSCTLAVTIFTMVFCASFSMPDINPFIGYGPLSREIERLDGGRGMDVETYGISRTEIMSFYTDIPIGTKWENIEEFVANPPEHCLFIVKSNRLKRYKEMADFVNGREFSRCGYFLIYEIP